MSLIEYNNAQRLGKKQYADDLAKAATFAKEVVGK